MALREHIKTTVENKEFFGDICDEDFSRTDLVNVYAVDAVFQDVTFKQSNLLKAYFRNCRFIRCDFTGANIKESNFRGSQFSNCCFKYTFWEKVIIDNHFLESCLPSEENLARDLVRSLRVNFGQIGNYEAVNIAAAIEVQLTGNHLCNAAFSRQSYYRNKYQGWARLSHFFQYIRWKLLDLLWGNGESVLKILMISVLVMFLATLFLFFADQKPLMEAARLSIKTFWGIYDLSRVSNSFVVALTVARFILFGLFMAILVKRLSKR